MKVIDVYSAYFGASCIWNGRERHAVRIDLTATSDDGRIAYELNESFFPHDDPDDFAVSYDAAASRTLYEAKGRRSRKREAVLLESLRVEADSLSQELDAVINWENLLAPERFG